MNETGNTRDLQRYIAIDIHKEYVMVGAWNVAQEWVIRPRRVEMTKFRAWAKNNLQTGDAVVIETTTNVWDIYDIVAPLVTRTVVAHAGAVRQIAEARVKTDKEDIKRLLRLLIANIVPEIWVPPVEVRELRGLISYRQRVVKTGAMIRNRLHSLLHRHNLALPEEGLISWEWWEQQELSALEKLQVRQEIALLEEVDKHKAQVDAELGKLSTGKLWGKQATYLMQLPGIGVIVAMTVLSAIGDVRRFEDARSLVGYAGLGAGVHSSGKEHKEKRITKSGRKELRWAMVEAAWRAVRMSPLWKSKFEELKRRMRPTQAIVAIARRLLVAVWHVLSKEETDRNASEEDLAWKMLLLSWSLGKEARLGLSQKQFAKYALLRLGVQSDLTSFMRGKVSRRIASTDEVLARMAELGLSG